MDGMWGGDGAGDAPAATGRGRSAEGEVADDLGQEAVDREALDRQLKILSRVAAVLRHMRGKRDQQCAA
jgi:hypothetical protein